VSGERRALRKSLRTNFTPGPRDYLNRASLRLRQARNLPAWAAGARLRRPIFIIGAPRSGTSMLYAILRTSSQLASWPGEAHEVWEADYHPALRGWDSNALGPQDLSPETGERISRSFFLVTGRNHRLIDKTPRNALRVPFIEALFNDAFYVFLTRDGRDNINSLINAWRTPRYRTYRLPEPHSIPGVDPQWWKFTLYPGWRSDIEGPLEVVCARQWKLSYEFALAGLETVPGSRKVVVAYEALVADPVAEVGRVLWAIGLQYEQAEQRSAEEARANPVNVVTPPERGKWRRENPKEIESVAELIAPTMRVLGYADAH
jgi:LPS sulfotransferase NodH